MEIMEAGLTSEPNNFGSSSNEVLEYKATNFQLVLKNSSGLRYDGNSFLSTCKEEVLKNLNPDFGSLMSDLDFSIENASSMIRQTEESAGKLLDFVSNHEFLFKTPPNNLKMHPDLLSVSRSSFVNITGSSAPLEVFVNSIRQEATTQDDLEILDTVRIVSKVNPPPDSELKRNHLDVGTRIWAMKIDLLSVWIKGVVTFVREGLPGSFKYEVRSDDPKISQKFYTSKQLAYINTPHVIVPVGTRIIARYTDDFGRSAHFAGIVAEPPKTINLKRYLIFFDNGCAQHVKHEDVYVVCAQSVDVVDDVHENISEFIRAYLLQYPERPMVKLQKDQIVKTEYNCKWSDAKVLEVDCSMVKMLFLTSQRTEWIYRGSRRLKPLCSELANAEAHRMEGKNRRRRIAPRRPHQPYVEYTKEEDVIVIDSDDENNVIDSVALRNTARKSLCTRPLSFFNVKGKIKCADQKSQLGYREIYINESFVRVPFHNHDCGIHCQEKEDPAKHKGKNPFLIPIFLGWERQLRSFRATGPGAKVFITYRSPCGRHLRNLKEVLNYLNLAKSRLTIDLFSFNVHVVIYRTFRPLEVLYSNKDITQGKENVPISCVNSLSDEPPPYVEYSSERFPGEGVYLNLDKSFLCGCECTDNCQNSATCVCQQLTNFAKYGTLYGDAGYKFRRLTEPVVTGIYECNSICKCNSQCGNRVVQNGLTIRLQMFKTEYKGWGIRCLDDIDVGQFICVYAGQLLTEQGADADGKECGDEYLAELDHIEVVEKFKEGYETDVPEFGPNFSLTETKNEEVLFSDDNFKSSDSDVICDDSDSEFELCLRSTAASTYATRNTRNGNKTASPIQRVQAGKTFTMKMPMTPLLNQKERKFKSIRSYFGEDSAYVMDAKNKGNIGRYLNHSCEPNIFVQNVFVDTHDLRFPSIAFFAQNCIDAGTELTWDYNYEIGSVEDKVIYCFCGANSCRGRLL